ncbi:MAG: hypothetical protein ABEN55_06470, partial [Bradymonadaceae bacterium]
EALPKDTKRAAHLGITLSNKLLSDLSNVAVESAITGALQIASNVQVDGKSIDLRTSGDIVKLSLEADEACDHCFEVGVSLGGRVTAEIPGVGTESAGLDGAAELVVPLTLTRGEDKSTAVELDFEQLAQIGASRVVARINDISKDWEDRLRRPLSNLILEVLGRKLKAVTLVEFDGPSFGLEGFELAPVALKSDAANGSVFAGFICHEAGHYIFGYLSGGGPFISEYHYAGTDGAMSSMDAGSPDAGSPDGGAGSAPPAVEGTPVGLQFQMHNFNEDGFCFSAGARTSGGVAVREGELQIGIRDVRFTSSSVPE